MASSSSWLPYVISLVGTAAQVDATNDAKKSQRRAESERRAANASDAARERRQQIREARIRRARVIQAAENTNTSDSSGEIGALGSIGTTLSANVGTNLGKLQSAQQISIFNQQTADAQSRAETAKGITNLGMSIFQASG